MNNIHKVQLKEIATIQMGYPFRSRLERDNSGNVSVIQMKDLIENGLLDTTDIVRVQMLDLPDRHLIQINDIIFRSRGQTTTAAMINQNLGNTVAAAPLMVIRVRSELVSPAFLTWIINQPSSQAFLSSHARGTSVLMVNKEAVDQMEIIMPSLERQQQIVELSELAKKEQELFRLLASMREQYMNQLLMDLTKR